MPETLPDTMPDTIEQPQTLRERQEAHERADELRRHRTTVTVKQTVLKVGVGRRSPKLPLILLPLIPAVLAGFTFSGKEIVPVVALPTEATPTLPSVVTAPNVNRKLRAGASNVPEAGPSNIPTLAPTSPPTLGKSATPPTLKAGGAVDDAAQGAGESAPALPLSAPPASLPAPQADPGVLSPDTVATPRTEPPVTIRSNVPTLAPKSNVPTLAPKSNIPTLPPTTKAAQAAVATTLQLRPIGPKTVVQSMLPDGRFTQFNALLAASGLNTTLAGPGPFTVFAPRDSAFAALPDGALDALVLKANRDALVQLLKYHLVPARLDGPSLRSGAVGTVGGSKLRVTTDANATVVGDTQGTTAPVEMPGQSAQNGVVYGIEAVLLPPGFTFPGQKNAAGDAVLEDLTVYFASGSSTLDRAAIAKVERAAAVLAALPAGTTVSMVGHADSRGSAERNQLLSEARVAAVLAAMQSALGETAASIDFRVEHRGSSEPAENLAKSRRVTIEIAPPSAG